MSTSKVKSYKLKVSISPTELLISKFYALRKSFEANYSGRLRSHKYEETREFTIALNHAIFQANQILAENIISFKSISNLEGLLENLRKDFNFLKS